jgi:hypothetical protein
LTGQVKLTAGEAVTEKLLVQVTGGWLLLVTVKVTVAVPPQAIGGPVLLLVKTALQPPVKVAVANQVLYLALMAACVWQAASVTVAGQVRLTIGAAVTVKVLVQTTGVSQVLFTVKVTVAVPPFALGVPALLFDKVALQPPVNVAPANHAAYLVSIWACVWQAASVTFAGQVNTTVGAVVTVKVRVQVTFASQLLATVKVTVAVPPHGLGAPKLLLVKTALQPPVKVAPASQFA